MSALKEQVKGNSNNIKYIIMCGGRYEKFETPKQLLKINGEVIVERIIRLLRENGITNIAISTDADNNAFDYLDVPILKRKNTFDVSKGDVGIKSCNSWLHAYYPMKEPACYLHGDVYFSPEAIKTIINTEVKDTMFFCTFDWSDGLKDRRNYKGREPFAYKVINQKKFRSAINYMFEMMDADKFPYLQPATWQLYRYLNGYDVLFSAKEWTEVNNIFKTKGDYIVINDYTTDVDYPEDAKILEEWLKK